MKEIDLNEITVFIQVAQTGSFTLAAKQLGMPNSTVSTKVTSLEKRLGVTLIQRTTRKLSLTLPGREYLGQCQQALGLIANAETQISSHQGQPRGLLRLTAPNLFGISILPDLLSKFTQTYPQVELELLLDDAQRDLISDGIDLAIRGGELKDSSLMIKKLGWSYFAAFASPLYIKKFGTPTHPKDLHQHQCLHFPPLGKDRWEFLNEKTKTRLQVSVPSKLTMNDLSFIRALAIKGSGIALLPVFICESEIKAGRLIRILPDWISNKRPIHFVYPAQKFVPSHVSAFIEMTTAPLRERLRDSQV